jgi:hypothetical protein
MALTFRRSGVLSAKCLGRSSKRCLECHVSVLDGCHVDLVVRRSRVFDKDNSNVSAPNSWSGLCNSCD